MRAYLIAGVFGLATLLAAGRTQAGVEQKVPNPLIPRALIFGNPERSGPQISPDGKQLAWLAPVNGVLNIWVAPIDKIEAGVPLTDSHNQGIRSYTWTYDGRHLLYALDSHGDGVQHIMSVDMQTRTVIDVAPLKGGSAFIEGISRKVRDQVMIGVYKRDPRYPDLYRLDLKTDRLEPMFANTDFARIVLDNQLAPRIAVKIRSDGDAAVMSVNGDGSTERFTVIPAEDVRSTQWFGFDDADKKMFVSDSRGRNTSALAMIDFASGEEQLLAEDPRVDFGTLFLDRMTNQPLLYSVNYIHREHKALSPTIQPELDLLSGQLGDDWIVINESEDGHLWLIGSSSDVHPGAIYLYDRPAKSLKQLFVSRPDLQAAPLAHMHGLAIKSRDGLDLVSYLTLPKGTDDARPGFPAVPLPMVLLVHGGPWGRDSFGMNGMHQWLANRGYAVLSVNFRGSSGFGKAFLNAGDGEWGHKMDDDLLDAVAWAIKQGIADPKRIAIVGGSYGGYAALVGMTRDADAYACGVDLSGPSDLEALLKNLPPAWESSRPLFYRGLGDPSTKAGLALIRDRSPLNHVGQIKSPLMIVQGENDPRVPKAQAERMAAAVKAKGTPLIYLLYSKEGHGLLDPSNSVSSAAAIESFLGTCLGGRVEPITEKDLQGASVQIMEGADLIPELAALIKPREVTSPAPQ